MILSEMMEHPAQIILVHETVQQAIEKFEQHNENELPVVNKKGQLVGIVTEKKLLIAAKNEKTNLSVHSVMDAPRNIMSKETKINGMIWSEGNIWKHENDRLWVVEDNQTLVGVIKQNQLDSQFIQNTNNNILLHSILEASFDGILVSDGQGEVVYVNRAYERITGLKSDRIVGRNLKFLLEEKVFNESAGLLAMERKTPVSITHKYMTGKQALTTGNPIFDHNGNIMWVICNTRDISELVKLRNELRDKKELAMKHTHEWSHLHQNPAQDEGIIFKSQAMERVLQLAQKASQYDSTVLILGESGVGKEVLAKYIHHQSVRKDGPFIKVNCAAIPSELIESELFGYAKGSFTGADQRGKPGLFELANEGTILLDEVGELSLAMQTKLLRVLQEKEIFPVGAREVTKLDVRVLAATNKNLEEEVRQGHFREDLFFRLKVVPITVPPLKDRKEDIPELAFHFIEELNRQYNKHKAFSKEVIEVFRDYSWPGNIRELQNLIEYLFIISPDDEIHIEQLPPQLLADHYMVNENSSGKLQVIMDRFEKEIISSTLDQHTSIRKAANTLGINPSTLVRKIKKLNIRTDA